MTIMNTSCEPFRHVNKILCVYCTGVHYTYNIYYIVMQCLSLQHGRCEKKWKTARNDVVIYSVDRRTKYNRFSPSIDLERVTVLSRFLIVLYTIV